MTRILQPTIDYARKGHPVHETIAYYWDLSIENRAPYAGFLQQMTIERPGAASR